MHLSSLHIYPIKSCGGISLTESGVDVFGLRYDRRFMVVTPKGEFITQRECAALAT
ncbi:MAG: MOSC N-terminal beta barrel domain-containing protein, partial [Gemmatimonadota bacterium]|nr:MOSC N-terminal beta barrel domain-containing protein [Gemmatimonadota bacterium]